MGQDNYMVSVGGAVLRGDEILLVRHTYGGAKGKLLIPGGFCKLHELPAEAARREVREETGVEASVSGLIALRCNRDNWYAVFRMEYGGGQPRSDCDENSEAVFMSLRDAIGHPEVTEITKLVADKLLAGGMPWVENDRYRKHKGAECPLYMAE